MGKIYSIREMNNPFKETLEFIKAKNASKNSDVFEAEFDMFAKEFEEKYNTLFKMHEVDCSIASEGDIIHPSGVIADERLLGLMRDSLMPRIENKTCLGETFYTSGVDFEKYLIQSRNPEVPLSKISHMVVSAEVGPDKTQLGKKALNAKIVILTTPEGKIINKLINDNLFQHMAVVQPRLEPVFEFLEEPTEPINNLKEVPVKNIQMFTVDFCMSIT